MDITIFFWLVINAVNMMLMYKQTTNYAGDYYVISQPTQVKCASTAVTTATSDHHMSLLPTYTGKWTNSTGDQTLTVDRDDRGEVFTVVSGGWPSAIAQMNVPINKSDKIVFEITGDAKTSIVVKLSNGAYFTMQMYMDGAELTEGGHDLILNGRTVSGEIPRGVRGTPEGGAQ